MKTYLTFWIFTFDLFLQLQFITSNTTVTDSSILNIIVENSTDINFEKQLKTNHASNNSFSSNSVNIGPGHSSHISDECKNGDCARNMYTSFSMDNSSTASKILWNLVSTMKSTSNQHSISDEGITVFPLNISVNTQSPDHPNEHNSSFYSSHNELDSKINFEDDVLDFAQSSEVINNSASFHTYLDFNFTTTTSESVTETIENDVDKIDMFEENSTLMGEATETYSETVTYGSVISNSLNMTEYITMSDIPETTIYGADEMLNLTSNFLNLFDTNTTEFAEKVNSYTEVLENLTTELPFSETDDSLMYEYNESSTLFPVDNDVTTKSEMLKSKHTELMNDTILESYATSYEESSVPLITENVNSSQESFIYDMPLESEEFKSKDDLILSSTDLSQNVPILPSTITPVVDTLVNENLWMMNNEIFNSTISTTISNHDPSVRVELFNNESNVEAAFVTSDNHDTYTGSDSYVNEASGNASSTFSMNIDTSTELVKATDHVSYLPQETKMSTSNNGLSYTIQNLSFVLNDSSEQSMQSNLWDEATTNGSLEPTELLYSSLPEKAKTSNEVASTVIYDLLTTSTHLDDSTESSLSRLNTVASHDLSISEFIKHNTTFSASNVETDITAERKASSTFNEEHLSSSVTTDIDSNINIVHMNNMHLSTTQSSPNLNDLNEIDNNLSSVQTNHVVVSSNPKLEETSTIFSIVTESTFTEYNLKENNHETETATQGSGKNSFLTDSYIETSVTATSEIPNEVLTSEHFKTKSNISSQNIDTVLTSTEKEGESDVITTDNSDRLINHTEQTPLEIITENIDNGVQVERTKMFSSFSTESHLNSEGISTGNDDSTTSSFKNISSTTISYYPKLSSGHPEKDAETTSSETETVRENTSSESDITGVKNFDTIPISNTQELGASTSFSSVEVSSLGVTETYREGKHIPFSSTLVRSTTEYPRILNVTVKTFSQPDESEATENNFVNLLYNQIKGEELSPDERSNLINAVVKLPDSSYNKEMLNEKIAIIHLWLLHAIADEYKNATLNLSGSSDGQLDEIEFENLPQILYVLPTPEIYLPNISFTFVVHNKWRNETFPVDLILTILNLHTEDLKHLVEIEEIHFSHGLLVQEHDLLSVIIEKYGIILLSTCFITVAMILLLICVVIYYRRKTRHSAHCLTDDKLHRNMQEAMGIDLNPAVIILQEEIREKAALNGNKICNLDDDEGWLAPIGDVPVGEDNNAPFVQDTKL